MPKFSVRDIIKRGLLDAIGKQADYQIIKQATEWLNKGVLEQDDLKEIQDALNATNTENQ